MENHWENRRKVIEFLGGSLEFKHVMDTLRSKYIAFVMNMFDLPDYNVDERWLYNFTSGVLNRPASQVTVSWILAQFSKQARYELIES